MKICLKLKMEQLLQFIQQFSLQTVGIDAIESRDKSLKLNKAAKP